MTIFRECIYKLYFVPARRHHKDIEIKWKFGHRQNDTPRHSLTKAGSLGEQVWAGKRLCQGVAAAWGSGGGGVERPVGRKRFHKISLKMQIFH